MTETDLSFKRARSLRTMGYVNPHYAIEKPRIDGHYIMEIHKGTSLQITETNDTFGVLFLDQSKIDQDQQQDRQRFIEKLEEQEIIVDLSIAPEAVIGVQFVGVNGTIEQSRVIFQHNDSVWGETLIREILTQEQCLF